MYDDIYIYIIFFDLYLMCKSVIDVWKGSFMMVSERGSEPGRLYEVVYMIWCA